MIDIGFYWLMDSGQGEEMLLITACIGERTFQAERFSSLINRKISSTSTVQLTLPARLDAQILLSLIYFDVCHAARFLSISTYSSSSGGINLQQ